MTLTGASSAQLATAVLAGDIAAGARLIRWLEDGEARGREVLREVFPRAGRAQLIGITGPPGAGKSTLADVLIGGLRARGRKVGVLAVDPTSPYSGGAILGDRVRMQRHATDTGVFIRSMGTRGELGGLARATFDAALVMDAMGFDPVIVETVGVGQDEVEIAMLAHTTVVVSVPGLGDDLQAMKAGVLETGQIFVVNKADLPGAAELRRQLQTMLRLRETSARADGWNPPLIDVIASRSEGIEDLIAHLEHHRAHLHTAGGFARRLGERNERVLRGEIAAVLRDQLLDAARVDPGAAAVLSAVREGSTDPYSAARMLLERWGVAPRGFSG